MKKVLRYTFALFMAGCIPFIGNYSFATDNSNSYQSKQASMSSPSGVANLQWVSNNPPYPGYVGYVTCTCDDGSYANIRSGPGSEYKVIDKLYDNDGRMWCTSVQNGYAYIPDCNGWVSCSYLYVLGTSPY